MGGGNENENVKLLTLSEALEQVDVHALKFVFQSKSRLVKLFWFCLFLGGLCAASYYIYKIILEFQSQPTATKVNAVEQAEYDYPHIYFCTRYSLDTLKLEAAGLSDEAIIYAASLLRKPPDLEHVRTDVEAEFDRYIRRGQFATYADFYKWSAFNFSHIIGEEPSVPLEFPLAFVAKPTYAGEPFAYRVCYRAMAEKYTPNIADSFYLSYEMKKPSLADTYQFGLEKDFMLVTNDHRVVLEKDRIDLRRNRIITIRLSAKKYINLNSDAEPCVPPDRQVAENYTHKNCRHECYVRAVEMCDKCVILTENTPTTIPSSRLCTWTKTNRLNTDCPQAADEYKRCLSSCLYPCEYYAYEISQTATVINFTNYQADHITVWMYYEVDDGILVYEEIPTYTWASMVSNIGGQLGLWCGASLLTGLELIYLLSYVTWTNWRAKRRAKNEERRANETALIADKANVPKEIHTARV